MKPTTSFVTWTRCFAFLLALLASLATGTASAIELRDAELVASGSPVLQNGSGTVRLEDSRMTPVPEPGALWQLSSGIGLLALLAKRHKPRIHTAAVEAPGRANLATTKRTMT